MISSLDKSGDQFLYNLERLQLQSARTQGQLSSGKQVNVPADAPEQVAQLLGFRTEHALKVQTQKNIQQLQTLTISADQAVSSTLQLADQAISLGTQGATSLESAQTRAGLAQQVQGITSQIVSLANTQVNGRYVFAGDQDQSAPYTFNAAAPNGVTLQTTLSNTQLVDDGTGTLASAKLTAQDIFDARNADSTPASGNLLVSLQNLTAALNSGTQDDITAAIAGLRASSQYVNSQQTFYGNWQQRLTSSSAAISQQLTALQTGISGIEDADIVQAAIDLSQEQTGLQAAYAGRAKAPHTSLFDFLG